ncbi:hypothetical protein TeGR_g2816 [Tetraparma gracilis]|uniref:Transmembrane protein 230 n=1 Tax=Tetraparma gracilis TaxID=2962635 RepID=A0ABQ6M412_9STRA|nr:hypothetical protein TeGR_g2816 [Tetraparma gracilis]
MSYAKRPATFAIRRPQLPIRSSLPPPVTTIAAVAFLITGLVLLPYGIATYLNAGDSSHLAESGRNMMILGTITILPGSYSTVTLFGAWRRWPGYSYGQVPNYDEAWGLTNRRED